MKQQMIFLLLLTALSWADLSADLRAARNEKQALEAEIKKLDQRISVTDSLARTEAARFEQLKIRNADDLARRMTELDSLQIRIAQVAADLQSEKNLQGNQLIQIENAKANRAAISTILVEECRRLEDLVSLSLPWDKQKRIDRIRALRRDLENENASPEEGLSRLKAMYTEEIRFSDEIILVMRPVTRNDGETINARLMRIGNQWMIYSDDEGTKFGILQSSLQKDGSVKHQWKEDLNFEERQAIKLALDVKQARKPPQIVSIPLSIRNTHSNGKTLEVSP